MEMPYHTFTCHLTETLPKEVATAKVPLFPFQHFLTHLFPLLPLLTCKSFQSALYTISCSYALLHLKKIIFILIMYPTLSGYLASSIPRLHNPLSFLLYLNQYSHTHPQSFFSHLDIPCYYVIHFQCVHLSLFINFHREGLSLSSFIYNLLPYYILLACFRTCL